MAKKKKKKRLNVKFLVILTSAFAVVLVLALVGAYFYSLSPGRAIRRAEEAEKEGKWDLAASQWGKAARYSNNDPTYALKALDASLHLTTADNGEDVLGRAFGAYSAILAADPGNLDALRGELRLLLDSGRLDVPSADGQTREIRRVAGELLKQRPDDLEAKSAQAAATLNLAGFAGEGVTPAQAEQARKDLESVAATGQGDGLALGTLTLRRLNDADQQRRNGDPAAALSAWQQAVALIDRAADQAGDLKPDAGLDAVDLRRRIGESYRAAARIKPFLDAGQLAQNDQAITGAQFQQLADDPVTVAVTDKAEQYLAAAAGALRDDRDQLGDSYRKAMVTYADLLQQRGKSDQAEAVLKRLVAARPWDAAAASSLARLLQQAGRIDEAVAVLRDQRKRDEDDLPDLAGYSGLAARRNRLFIEPQLADLLLSRREQVGDGAQKEALLKEASGLFDSYDAQRRARGYPDSPEALRIHGQIQLAQGQTVAGLQTLNSALRLTEGTNSPQEAYERVRALGLVVAANEKLGQIGEVRRTLEQMVKLRPDLPQLRAQLAGVYLSQGDREQAKPIIEALLKASPDNAAYQQLALRATPADEQAAAYEKMPETTDAERRVKLVAANRLAERPEVIRLGRAVLADKPGDPAVSLLLAQQLAAADRKEEAAAVLQPIVDSVPQANILLRQIQGGAEAAVEAMPEGINKLLVQAQIAASKGDGAGAVERLEAARKLEPDNTAVANALFDAYVNQKRIDDAAALADGLKARNLDGMNGRGYDVRVSLARGETDRAVREAQSLASDFPQLAEALGLQGAALLRAGRPDEAADSYRRALDLAPDNTTLLGGMVASLQSTGRGKEVKPYLDAALRAEPNNPAFRNAETAFELQYGDPQAVIARRRDAVTAAPDSADAKLALGQALLAAGAARRDAKAPDGGAEAQGYLSKALDAYKAGLTQFPQDARFFQGIVASAVQGGDKLLAAAAPAVDAAVNAPAGESGQDTLLGDPRAAASAAEFYVARDEPAKAETVLRQAVAAGNANGNAADARPREQTAALLMLLGEVIARQGRVDDAVAVLAGYEDLPSVKERQVTLLATRAAANLQDQAAYDALRRASDKAVDDGTLTAGALNAVGYTELQRGDIGRAETLFAASAAKRPDDPRTLFFQAAVESRKPGGSLERATELLARARSLSPRDPDVLRELARVQRLRGRTDEAAATLAGLAEVVPTDVSARLDLLNLLMAATPPRTAEAARVFREADAAGIGRDPQLLMAHARVELSRNRATDALDYAKQAADAADNTPQAGPMLNSYLILLLQQNRPEIVLQRTQAPAADAAAPWWLLRARGEALAKVDRRADAVAAYTRAYKQAESQPGAGERVLRDMVSRVGLEPAYALVKDEVEPADGSAPDADLLATAASLYATAGQTDGAVDLLRRALAAPSAADLPQRQRAAIESALGSQYLSLDPPQLDEAERLFREVLKIAPRDLGTVNNLAYTMSQQAERAGADSAAAASARADAAEFGRQAYELAKAATPAGSAVNPNVTDTYAWAMASKAIADGDAAGLEQAAGLLRGARTAAEDGESAFPEIYLHLSRTLAAQNDGESAVEAAQAGLGFVEKQRQAKKPVDAAVVEKLQSALADARKLGDGDKAQAAG